jgi:16S rRNA (cytidine1402-2'-O)-methyltransferase
VAGRLFLVGTPIGNLGDISQRAIDTLREVDFVICEDTRHSGVLLEHLSVHKERVSLPAFAEKDRADRVLERIVGGHSAALVTDAGTPAVSDPGELLVAHALEQGIEVIPIPGPSAVVTALCASGLPTGRFHFLGFLPRQHSDRLAILEEVAALKATLILYESPRRAADTLKDLLSVLGNRRAVIARELTKRHEQFLRGTLEELFGVISVKEPLGEITVLVEGRSGEARWTEAEVVKAIADALASGLKLKELSTQIAKRAGWTGHDVYRLGLQIKRS